MFENGLKTLHVHENVHINDRFHGTVDANRGKRSRSLFKIERSTVAEFF
jgi:hypothetical protein